METLKPEEALNQIAYMHQLINQSRVRISGFAPGFILWGVLWMTGYLGTLWAPPRVGEFIWPAVYLVGFGLPFVHGLRSGGRQPTPDLFRKLMWVTRALLAGYIGLPFLFFTAPSQHTVNAYYPFVIGLIYIANGIFYGREIVAIGAWLVAASAAASVIPLPAQAVFLALAGGGSLVLTGLLLRRQVAGR